MARKYQLAQIEEEIMLICNCCGEEDPVCDKCERDLDDNFYCNKNRHLCKECKDEVKK